MGKIKDEDLRLNVIVNGNEGLHTILIYKKNISNLTAQITNLKKEQDELSKHKDPISQATIRENNKHLTALNKSLEYTKQKLSETRRQWSLNDMTISELSSHIRQVRSELRDAVPNTENWKNLNNELMKSNRRMSELKTMSRSTNETICSFAEGAQRLSTMVASAYYVFQKFFGSVKITYESFLTYDEALTDAIKTTGLTKDEVSDLSRELSKVDTKTAQNELLGLVRAGGKLGISGQEDLLGFAKAADKINVALGSDLGGDAEEAITSIGKMVDIFNLKGEFGIEKSMLKVGSAINELGMASTANEGYIVDFSKRLAGIAPNANISISKVLGLSATLDKYGQQSETSATAIGQTIMAMFKRTRTFADIAGLSLKDLQVSQVRSLG